MLDPKCGSYSHSYAQSRKNIILLVYIHSKNESIDYEGTRLWVIRHIRKSTHKTFELTGINFQSWTLNLTVLFIAMRNLTTTPCFWCRRIQTMSVLILEKLVFQYFSISKINIRNISDQRKLIFEVGLQFWTFSSRICAFWFFSCFSFFQAMVVVASLSLILGDEEAKSARIHLARDIDIMIGPFLLQWISTCQLLVPRCMSSSISIGLILKTKINLLQ